MNKEWNVCFAIKNSIVKRDVPKVILFAMNAI